jgi:putative FmdB family regulatory protein
MPTYDYACDACEHTWEEFQSIKAEPTKKCPSCGKKKAKRLISAGAGFLFKGSGFYITDYRSDSYKKSADADKKSTSGGETKSESSKSEPSKTESKRSSKSESKPAPASK